MVGDHNSILVSANIPEEIIDPKGGSLLARRVMSTHNWARHFSSAIANVLEALARDVSANMVAWVLCLA